MTDEQPTSQQGHFHQPDWKPENITQIAQQTVYNTYAGQTPPAADEKRHFFTVPFPRNPDFVGRDADLTTLHTALTSGYPANNRLVGILPVGLTGQGGMGKTALAVEYCFQHSDNYPGGVFWVNATEPLAQGFATLGCLIDPANFDRSVSRQIDAASLYLNNHADALLVLDNVEDPATLTRPVTTGLIPTELVCRVLFTTRRRDLPWHSRAVEVTVLPKSAALSLLLCHPARQPQMQATHPGHGEAMRICLRLGYLPLALEIAGSFLGEWPEIGLTDFRARLDGEGAVVILDEEWAELPASRLSAIHQQAVGAVLRAQWDALDNDDARLILRIAGQLPETAQISAAHLGVLTGLAGDERPGRPGRLARALRRLDALSLVEELSGDELRLHPLVWEFAASQTPASEQESFRSSIAENLDRAYSTLITLENSSARGRHLHHLGIAYSEIGNIESSILCLLQALEIAQTQQEWGYLGNRLNSLGLVYQQVGAYREAIDVLGRSLFVARELGDEGRQVAFLGNLAENHLALGNLSQGLDCSTQALALAQANGFRQVEANELGRSGSIHYSMGELTEAVGCYEAAYEIYVEIEDQIGRCHCLMQLGSYQSEIGHVEAALDYLARAQEVAKNFGDRVLLARCLRNTAMVQIDVGDYEEGAHAANLALAIAQTIGDRIGEAHDLIHLGNIEVDTGQFKSAINRYKAALTIAEEADSKVLIATCLNNLGFTFYKQGDRKAALHHCRRALQLAQVCKAAKLADNIQSSLDEIAENPPTGARMPFWRHWTSLFTSR